MFIFPIPLVAQPVVFNKTFGGNEDEFGNFIQQTTDGGYIVAGQTESYGAGLYDMWILKLDKNGNTPEIVVISNSNNNHLNGFSLSQNYPNP
jgi:hypothetical protein